MKIFADLHIHSKYSRATSQQMDVEHLSRYGREKGLSLIGTGDFTHPKWLAELKQKLQEIETKGHLTLADEDQEHEIKKQKLRLKDQMNQMLARHKAEQVA